jgi:hypothetical protein
MITNGRYFTETLAALGLETDQAAATTQNATAITNAVIAAYGVGADGNIDAARIPRSLVTGLVYGRIQSGKTRAMIASTAMAFDNGFRISVVMTSNINDLVAQTHIDFTRGIPGITTFTKDNNLGREVTNTRLYLERGNGRLLIICSKGATSLNNISQFLRQISANQYPTILFDDEGDQASLDTNTRRRSRTGVAVAPSSINNIIQNRLRTAVPRHVYVSVTGTPQAVLLQSADSTHRPSFIEILPPGGAYVGGQAFFNTEEPEDNPGLIALVDQNEQRQLLSRSRAIPDGLRQSILFFLVSAAAALRNLPHPEHGYSYLCHPGLKNDEQETAEGKISTFLTNVYDALLPGARAGAEILRDLRIAHGRLVTTLAAAAPSFDDTILTILQYLPTRRLLVINARVKRQGIQYGQGLNFLIGGNTLGRGIAIRDLLVTYYVRTAQVSQIDTMHQHARMYGYRSNTLAYTRLFIPPHLYYRFRDIHHSDEDLREFIEQHRAGLPTTFPVEFAFNLRTTRPGVLDVGKIDTLRPGMQIFPNQTIVPQAPRSYNAILDQLRLHFGSANGTPQEIERLARQGQGIAIDTAAAIALIAPIRTGSRNTWRDSTISAVIAKVTESFDDQIILRFRTANRRIREGGLISTGTLSGDEVNAARLAAVPTLWIMAASTTADSEGGAGQRFMYPTFVIPARFPSLFMFNRG